LTIPLIAAGGIATGKGMLAAMVLADGVQVGSRFAFQNHQLMLVLKKPSLQLKKEARIDFKN
jgi:dihydroorotate dehydrogenase